MSFCNLFMKRPSCIMLNTDLDVVISTHVSWCRAVCQSEWFLCRQWWMSGKKSRSAVTVVIFILCHYFVLWTFYTSNVILL